MICIKKATTSKQIKQEGGSLAVQSYGISLTIPPGAIKTTALLDVTLSLYVSDEAINLEGRTARVGFIELLPHKTAFAKPVILRYKLRHHHKPGNDCIETVYGLFYDEGIDPSEIYDFMGSLGTGRFQSRHVSYKGTMDVYLRDDCLELSTKTFCRYCSFVTAGPFHIEIGFFVRPVPRNVCEGERRWDIRITISCTCSENLRQIQEQLKTRNFRLADTKRFCCQEFFSKDRERLEFSLSEDDDFTSGSKFSLRSKKEFNGWELRSVVEKNDRFPGYLDRDCAIKCTDAKEANCSPRVTFAYRYYKPLSSFSQDVISSDGVSFKLPDEAPFGSVTV